MELLSLRGIRHPGAHDQAQQPEFHRAFAADYPPLPVAIISFDIHQAAHNPWAKPALIIHQIQAPRIEHRFGGPSLAVSDLEFKHFFKWAPSIVGGLARTSGNPLLVGIIEARDHAWYPNDARLHAVGLQGEHLESGLKENQAIRDQMHLRLNTTAERLYGFREEMPIQQGPYRNPRYHIGALRARISGPDREALFPDRR